MEAPAMHRLVSSEFQLPPPLEHPGHAVLSIDDRGVRLSSAAARLLHRPYADTGPVALDAIVPRHQPDGRQSLAVFAERLAAVRGGHPQTFRFEFRREDGHPLDALVSLAAEASGSRVSAALDELPPLAANAEALRSAALAVSGAEGDAVFRELTRYLATTLGVEYSFISACTTDAHDRVRTLAIYTDGAYEDNVEYQLSGTACGTVVGQHFRIVQEGVQREYPEDRMFRRWNTEAYAAYPLTDSIGRPLGLIAVLSRRRIENVDLVESMLKIFAARAAAELERARVEAAHRASEASYRAIFEAAEDAIFIHDWDTGAVVDVNPKACHVYGYTRDEMRRVTVADISSGEPPYTASEAARLIEAAKTGEPVRFEWHRRSRDGSLHWDEVCLKSAMIGGQRRVLAFSREITERKVAEADLRASEEQYRAIFTASTDGMVVIGPDRTIVDVNPAYVVLYGYERAEVVGGAPGQRLTPECSHVCGELIETVTAGGHFQREVQALRKGGTVLDVEVLGMPMHYRGQPHILVTVRDISARKRAEAERTQLEAQLRQAQKMEAIGHLTGGIAHDFNNILTSITGYLVMASERPGALADAKLAKYVEQAQLASTKARDLIRQMLTFSRGQRGERHAVNLASTIRESVRLITLTLPSSIELQTELDDDVPPVLIDPVQVEQVLLNLCINARDVMEGAGVIRVAVEGRVTGDAMCSSCRKPVEGRWVELSVSDNGRGIAPEVMDRMFEPFFSTKEVGKGSGMGLSTVHGIVHEHGGHVLVESHRGVGSCFRVLLPARDDYVVEMAEEGGAANAGSAHAARLRGRVLVVEDEQLVREFMADLLRDAGLDVTVEASAVAARDRFRADPDAYDLVVTDQTMPRLSGIALARELAAIRPGLPVVLYTGYTESITPEAIANAGVRALLGKPVEPAVLLEVLRKHLPA
jgi:PAS domain S-box-containing protein